MRSWYYFQCPLKFRCKLCWPIFPHTEINTSSNLFHSILLYSAGVPLFGDNDILTSFPKSPCRSRLPTGFAKATCCYKECIWFFSFHLMYILSSKKLYIFFFKRKPQHFTPCPIHQPLLKMNRVWKCIFFLDWNHNSTFCKIKKCGVGVPLSIGHALLHVDLVKHNLAKGG